MGWMDSYAHVLLDTLVRHVTLISTNVSVLHAKTMVTASMALMPTSASVRLVLMDLTARTILMTALQMPVTEVCVKTKWMASTAHLARGDTQVNSAVLISLNVTVHLVETEERARIALAHFCAAVGQGSLGWRVKAIQTSALQHLVRMVVLVLTKTTLSLAPVPLDTLGQPARKVLCSSGICFCLNFDSFSLSPSYQIEVFCLMLMDTVLNFSETILVILTQTMVCL